MNFRLKTFLFYFMSRPSNDQEMEKWLSIRPRVFKQFLQNHSISVLKPWQQEFLNLKLDPEERTGKILQLPPGAGKTIASIWVILEHLALYPTKRVLYAVPLRLLAKQQAGDIEKDLRVLSQETGKEYTVGIAEGPGAKVDYHRYNVVVATYEHAATELRKNPFLKNGNAPVFLTSLVVIDEVHEISKDRGLVVDDVLYFCAIRASIQQNHFPRVLAMSGTLSSWVADRLYHAYANSIFYNGIYSPETASDTSAKASKVWLANSYSNSNIYIPLIRKILHNIAVFNDENDQGKRLRMVVFLDYVKKVEAAYLAMAVDKEIVKNRGYPTAPFKLATAKSDLMNELENYSWTNTDAVVSRLQNAGIYIHHAQLVDDPAGNGKNITEAQLSGSGEDPSDFLCVFTTSTLATGINLAPTQVGFLGPNSIWSTEQTSQMVGRVGRLKSDADNSVVFIVDGPRYNLPGLVSVAAPEEWFVSRLLSTKKFDIKKPDLRGFFSPPNAAAPGLIYDRPGNGVMDILERWELIDSDGHLIESTEAALQLSQQDPRNLQATLALTRSKNVGWQHVILWALLLSRFPSGWYKSVEKLSSSGMPNFFPEKYKKEAYSIISSYGEAYESYPGDEQTPSSSTFNHAMIVFNNFVYAIGIKPSAWAFGNISQLLDTVSAVKHYLDNVIADVMAFFDHISDDCLVKLSRGLRGAEKLLNAVAEMFTVATKIGVRFERPDDMCPLSEVVANDDLPSRKQYVENIRSKLNK